MNSVYYRSDSSSLSRRPAKEEAFFFVNKKNVIESRKHLTPSVFVVPPFFQEKFQRFRGVCDTKPRFPLIEPLPYHCVRFPGQRPPQPSAYPVTVQLTRKGPPYPKARPV